MRGCLAVMAVAATASFSLSAAGQTISECNNRQAITEMALEVKDSVARGKSEDSLLAWAGGIEGPGLQAAAYKAIDAYTFYVRPNSTSQVVSVMQYVCKKTYRP